MRRAYGWWRRWTAVGAAALVLGLGAAEARAVSLGFDDLPSLSDVAAAAYPGVAISTNLVVSEADAFVATGYDTSGWATTEPNGVLNSLEPVLAFTFSTPVSDFGVDVVGLPDGLGGFTTVLLQAYRGADLVGLSLLDTGVVAASGFPQQRLTASAFEIDRVVLTPVVVGGGEVPTFTLVDETTTFFADSVSFTPVPEPGTALLLLAGGAAVAAARRNAR